MHRKEPRQGMKKLFYTLFICVLLNTLCALRSVAASAPEILSVNVNVTLLSHTLIGTYVVQRNTTGAPESWTFNGMLDGKRGTANGTITERWDANGHGTLELITFSSTGIAFDQIPTRTITLDAGTDVIFTLLGVPFAIKGTISPPGAGNASIFITNAGQGTQLIQELPNTSGDASYSSATIAGAMITCGLPLLSLGLRWRRRIRNATAE